MNTPAPILPAFSHLPESLLQVIASFCDATSLAQVSACSKLLHDIFSDENNWKNLCDRFGFPQHSVTKTRGWKPWKQIYLSKRCFECNMIGSKGTIVLDTNGGNITRYRGVDSPSSSLVPLCASCFHSVHTSSAVDRCKFELPNAKKKSRFIWQQLCNLIPMQTRKGVKVKLTTPQTRSRQDEEYFGADENNGLIRKLSRK